MDTSLPEHENLGTKHKKYNELLGKVLKSKENVKLEDINLDKYDQDNLLMIDVANEKRDLEYILRVLKSNDILYVSRALQNCTWLFTDNQYAHIVNPQYLHDELLPEMTTKAGNKLVKYTRRHLSDPSRVEQFYLYEKKTKDALKWLPNCSTAFIEEKVTKHGDELEPKLFKRLIEKSVTIFEIVARFTYCSLPFSKYAMFLLKTHTEQYLNVFERTDCCSHRYPKFNAKATAVLMKKTPDRIINHFEKFVEFIDIASFAKHMKKEQIKDFLLEQANKDLKDWKYNSVKRFLKSPEITYLIERIPRQERFDFVKTVFIDNATTGENEDIVPLDPEICRIQKLSQAVRIEKHQWYKFAPFDIAFEEITKMIKVETNHDEKYAMLFTLICCVGKNEKDLQTLLKYYISNHINDECMMKNHFVKNLIEQTEIYKYDNISWEMLNELFNTMDIYVEKCGLGDYQDCIISIILHNCLNDQSVPEIITKKFSFDTLESYRNKLKSEEQEKVFTFLYNDLLPQIENYNITTETEFIDIIEALQQMMKLLKHWKKELSMYPFILKVIRDIVEIKQKNSWETSLETLYTVNKSWRKLMFEESLVMYPSEEVCVNALKHDPGLLKRYNENVQRICCNDKISVRRLHNKLRIYWPESLGMDWANLYRERLSMLGDHKALIRGLCSLIPEKYLVDIIKNYAPKDLKINWNEIDELTLSLQRHIAKNMHYSRPLIDPNAIILYAKGDYLKYTLPSLLSVFYNMKLSDSRQFIPKLIDAPVSVQKHGIRFAFLRLEPTDLKTIFLDMWKSSKNLSIRAELFVHTFKLLCKSKDTKAEEVWTLLELFVDNLTHTDESKIFDLVVRIQDVPLIIRAKYLVTCYNMLKRLLHQFSGDRINRYENYMQNLAEYSREIMESVDSDFIAEIILEFLNKELFNFEGKSVTKIRDYNGMVKVVSAYLLCTKDAEQQRQRYELILAPTIKRLLKMETSINIETMNFFNFAELLFRLYKDLKAYVLDKNLVIPYRIFYCIQGELETLPVPENYKMVTMWNLITMFAKLLSESDMISCQWDEVVTNIAPDFANICRSYLKEEVNNRFSCIYVIFSRVLNSLLDEMPNNVICTVYEMMLEDKDFVEAFLAVITMLPNQYYTDYTVGLFSEIHQRIEKQPSLEIKMHYYSKFKKYVTSN